MSFPSTSGWLVCKRLELWEKPEKCQQIVGQEGVGNTMGVDGPGGCDMESWPRALPWGPDLKGVEEKNLFLVPHPCLSAWGEGQLDEDKGGFSTGVTFGGFPGQERHQWQQAPFTHH